MAGYPLIDIYCHIFPERFFQEMIRVAPNLTNIGQRLRNVKKLFDLDLRFREMDGFGDYRQVISLPNPPIEDLATGATGLTLARIGKNLGGKQLFSDLSIVLAPGTRLPSRRESPAGSGSTHCSERSLRCPRQSSSRSISDRCARARPCTSNRLPTCARTRSKRPSSFLKTALRDSTSRSIAARSEGPGLCESAIAASNLEDSGYAMLGTRASSPARASAARVRFSIFELDETSYSRFALSADGDVRAPSYADELWS